MDTLWFQMPGTTIDRRAARRKPRCRSHIKNHLPYSYALTMSAVSKSFVRAIPLRIGSWLHRWGFQNGEEAASDLQLTASRAHVAAFSYCLMQVQHAAKAEWEFLFSSLQFYKINVLIPRRLRIDDRSITVYARLHNRGMNQFQKKNLANLASVGFLVLLSKFFDSIKCFYSTEPNVPEWCSHYNSNVPKAT